MREFHFHHDLFSIWRSSLGMGRQQRKRNTSSSSSSSASKNHTAACPLPLGQRTHHPAGNAATRELLAAILDLCGFWDHENDDYSSQDFVEVDSRPRRKLIYLMQRLQLLAGATRLLTTRSHHHHHHQNDKLEDEAMKAILRLEDYLAQVRSEISSYLEELLQESAEMGDLVAKTEEQQPESIGARRCACVSRSIQTAFKDQIQKERGVLHRLVQSLDSFYSDEKESGMMVVLDEAVNCLKREPMLQRPDFLAVEVLLRREGQPKRDQMIKPQVNERLFDSPQFLNVKSTMDTSVIRAESIWKAVEAFLLDASRARIPNSCETKVTSLLVVGEQGCGKTHLCEKVRTTAQEVCTVIFPSLPLDLLGSSVGETEDTLVALTEAMRDQKGPVVLIVDGLEHLFPWEDSGLSFLTRTGSTFLSLLEAVRQSVLPGSRILILCTSIHKEVSRLAVFDRVFSLGPPNDSERRAFIESIIAGKSTTWKRAKKATDANNDVHNLIFDVVEATIGKSYAEIVQLCRQGVEDAVFSDKAVHHSDFPTALLCALQERLQTNTPESLKQGIIENSFDMRILTSRDLRSIENVFVEKDGSLFKYKLPMKGTSAERAWKELERSIVVPLCRSKELNRLVSLKNATGESPLTGGILISGNAGSGKTEIATHCARYASHQLPNLKTLEVACTSLIHKEVGGSEQAIKRMFDSARKAAPCILILDGIENITAVRGNDPTTEGTLDRVLSTVLTELDGINTSLAQGTEGMAVIGITHNAALIDPALKRPGRLQRTVHLQIDWN